MEPDWNLVLPGRVIPGLGTVVASTVGNDDDPAAPWFVVLAINPNNRGEGFYNIADVTLTAQAGPTPLYRSKISKGFINRVNIGPALAAYEDAGGQVNHSDSEG